MSQVVVRTDEEIEAALAHLVHLTGRSRSAVIRDAIRDAERQAVLRLAARQAAEVAADEADRAEMAAVAADLEALRAW